MGFSLLLVRYLRLVSDARFNPSILIFNSPSASYVSISQAMSPFSFSSRSKNRSFTVAPASKSDPWALSLASGTQYAELSSICISFDRTGILSSRIGLLFSFDTL